MDASGLSQTTLLIVSIWTRNLFVANEALFFALSRLYEQSTVEPRAHKHLEPHNTIKSCRNILILKENILSMPLLCEQCQHEMEPIKQKYICIVNSVN